MYSDGLWISVGQNYWSPLPTPTAPHRTSLHYSYLSTTAVCDRGGQQQRIPRGWVYPEGCKLGNVETQLCTCGIILYLPLHTFSTPFLHTLPIHSLHLPHTFHRIAIPITYPHPQKKVTVLSACLQFVYIS